MAIRDDLLTGLTTRLAGSSVSVSTELPFVSGDIPLYQKNMKKVYLDEQQVDITEVYNTLDRGDVSQTETIINAYLCVDAKNSLTDIASIINLIQSERTQLTDNNQFIREVDLTTDFVDDKVVYTFEYRFIAI